MSAELQVKEAFEHLALEVEGSPDAWSSTRSRVRRARRRRRALGISTIILVATTSFLAIPKLIADRSSRFSDEPAPGWSGYTDPDYGWTLSFPSDWHSQRVQESQFEYHAEGILISNVDHTFRTPDLGGQSFTSAWDMRGLPSSLVVVEVAHIRTIPGPCPGADTPLPLSLKDAKSYDFPPGQSYGAPQPELSLSVTAKRDNHYAVLAWIGADASSADRAILDNIVASISFENARQAEPPSPGFNCVSN